MYSSSDVDNITLAYFLIQFITSEIRIRVPKKVQPVP